MALVTCVLAPTSTVGAAPGAADVEARVASELTRVTSLRDRGRDRAALSAIEALERIAPGRAEVVRLHLALVTRASSRRELVPLLRACASPRDHEAALECARAFAIGHDFTRALSLAAPLARYDPATSAALADIGLAARDAGARDIAATCAERAYALAPDDPARTIVAAMYRVEAGLPASASALLEPLLVAQPEDLAAREVAAEAAMLAGDHERAIAHYRVLATRCPNEQAARCLTDLATAELYGGHLDAAEQTATRATERACPEDPRPHRVLGLVLIRLGREADARRALDESLRRRPDATALALRRALDPP